MKEEQDSSASEIENKSQSAEDKLAIRVDETLNPYLIQLRENTSRVIKLIKLYISLSESQDFKSHDSLDDILRLCVVFTHATLEDFLRTIAARLLPIADKDVLNQIPLEGISPSGRAEKFLLGNLTHFRGKTVDDVIQQSVISSLQRSNFNNTDDIAQLLKNINVDVSKVNQNFSDLENLMRRRHLIVHRADKESPINSDERNVTDINGNQALDWLMAVVDFINSVLSQTTIRELIIKGALRKEVDKFYLQDI